MRRKLIVLVVVGGMIAFLAGSMPAEAATKPDATLTLSGGSVAAGVGWSWSKGVLTYKGKTYPISVKGLSVGEVGVTKAKATGKVHHLKKLEDIEGVYAAGGAEATAGKGAGGTELVNANGVHIDIKSATKGASLKLAVEGLKLELEK